MDILKLMPRSFPSSEPGSMMMSVTIFTVRKLLSSRKKSDTITTVATIESTEPGTVPSVKSRGTFLRAEGGPTVSPARPAAVYAPPPAAPQLAAGLAPSAAALAASKWCAPEEVKVGQHPATRPRRVRPESEPARRVNAPPRGRQRSALAKRRRRPR